jgi:hypothetical protein
MSYHDEIFIYLFKFFNFQFDGPLTRYAKNCEVKVSPEHFCCKEIELRVVLWHQVMDRVTLHD